MKDKNPSNVYIELQNCTSLEKANEALEGSIPGDRRSTEEAQYYSDYVENTDGDNDTIDHLDKPSGAGGECMRKPEENRVILDQERFLPIANISRIMKRMIPENGKLAKDAKECVQECVSEFISFITSEASDRCMLEKRKTISSDDMLHALRVLGFDDYVEPMSTFLKRKSSTHCIRGNREKSLRNKTRYRQSHRVTTQRIMHDISQSTPLPQRPTAGPPFTSFPATDLKPEAGVMLIPMEEERPRNETMMSVGRESPIDEEVQNDLEESMSEAPMVMEGGSTNSSMTQLEHQPMQIYMEPTTKQHYIAIESDGSMQFYPIIIQTDAPIPVQALNAEQLAHGGAPLEESPQENSAHNDVEDKVMKEQNDRLEEDGTRNNRQPPSRSRVRRTPVAAEKSAPTPSKRTRH